MVKAPFFLEHSNSPNNGLAVPINIFSKRYEALSNEARLLYSILVHLRFYSTTAIKKDDSRITYVVYPRVEAAKDIRVGLDEIDAIFNELEKYTLIKIGTQDEIYVRNFASKVF